MDLLGHTDIALVLLTLTGMGAAADSPSARTDNVGKDDADFVKAAASGAMMEVQLGRNRTRKGI